MKLLLITFLSIAASAIAEDTQCEPGSTFQLDCNMCYCSQDGKSASCTAMACPPEDSGVRRSLSRITRSSKLARQNLVTKDKCKPGTGFKDYCNSCICGLDGITAACTLMACDKNIWNPDGTLKIPLKI